MHGNLSMTLSEREKKKIVCQGATAAAANGIMAGFESAGVFLFFSLFLPNWQIETGK